MAPWTNVQNRPHAQDLKLKDKHQKMQNSYDATEQQRFEAELLEQLSELRSKSESLHTRFLKGEVFDLALKTNIQNDGNEDDETGMDDDQPEDVEEDREIPSPTTDRKGKGKVVEPEPTREEDADRLDPYVQSQIDEATRIREWSKWSSTRPSSDQMPTFVKNPSLEKRAAAVFLEGRTRIPTWSLVSLRPQLMLCRRLRMDDPRRYAGSRCIRRRHSR